jgi:hypothetical protein
VSDDRNLAVAGYGGMGLGAETRGDGGEVYHLDR